MTTLTGAPPVSIAFAGPMSLTPPPVSREIYNDAKLLIEELNKHAGSESYAVVTARSKKSKKDVDRIVYIRCDREGKASLNSGGFERRLHTPFHPNGCRPVCSVSYVAKEVLKQRY